MVFEVAWLGMALFYKTSDLVGRNDLQSAGLLVFYWAAGARIFGVFLVMWMCGYYGLVTTARANLHGKGAWAEGSQLWCLEDRDKVSARHGWQRIQRQVRYDLSSATSGIGSRVYELSAESCKVVRCVDEGLVLKRFSNEASLPASARRPYHL